jgi:hypothetical protein
MTKRQQLIYPPTEEIKHVLLHYELWPKHISIFLSFSGVFIKCPFQTHRARDGAVYYLGVAYG